MSLAESVASVNGAFDSIPIIDIGHASTHEERAALARQIRDACMNVGFFYSENRPSSLDSCHFSNGPTAVRNHGIPEETIDRVLSAMKAFFSLPLERKMKVCPSPSYFVALGLIEGKIYRKQSARVRGYEPLLDSNVDPANRGDPYESFMIDGEELVPRQDDSTIVENLWPSEPAGFREAFRSYYRAALGVGQVLHRLFALALDLPETFFDDKLNRYQTMRGLHYPPQTGPEDDRIIGIGAHSDFECFTILWQEPGVQALQVLNSEKKWINAPPIPGTLVINISDLLSRWTNDIFRSTVHRVVNRNGVHRYSIPLFFGTNTDVEVEPLPSCVSPERPAKYKPINAGEYVQKLVQDMRQQSFTASDDASGHDDGR
ncbi:hypothetical protein EDD16DRAFT_1712176 [Pisolithus croceorrhizus]|nr:hypothetical protein EDD16DRAFT_1712176 [Pisolithus croceorrhizus]KAI6158347.1 hypothetical protein EDD17DRAFT_1844857 [Pisolithus thermaeus]